MVKVRISAALERELRGVVAAPETTPGLAKLAAKLIALVDESRARGEEPGVSPGLSYQTVLRILNSELGSRLVLPPKPTAGWISRLMNRVKDLGLEEDHLRTAAKRGAAEVAAKTRNPNAPVDAEWLIWQSARLLAGATEVQGRDKSTSRGEDSTDEIQTGRSTAYPKTPLPISFTK